jgi:type III secretion system low calcium response chaperone LcrH/SycD
MDKHLPIESLSPQSLELLYSIAYSHVVGARFQEAEKLFYSLVIHAPENVKFWKALAHVQQKLLKYDEAWATYALVSNLSPEDPEPYLRAAECYFADGKVTDGLDALKEVEHRIQNAPKYQVELTRLQQAWQKKKPSRKPCK